MTLLLRADSGRTPTRARRVDSRGRRRPVGPVIVPNFPLRSKSVQCVVCSPPYLGLRIYGGDRLREVGDGSFEDYFTEMLRFMLAVRDVLDDAGVCWLNIGDSASGSGGAGGDHNPGGSKSHIPKYRPPKMPMDRMQFALVPDRLAIRIQDLCECGHDRMYHDPDIAPGRTSLRAGSCSIDDCGCAQHLAAFLVRKRITWDKGRPRRGDENFAHTRRPAASSEVIYMITKGHQITIDDQRTKAPKHRWYPEVIKGWPKAEQGDVWHFKAGQENADKHYAPYPDELPARCIALTTHADEDHIVLDPFLGSGTTSRVATAMGRRAVGFDLYAGVPHVYQQLETLTPS